MESASENVERDYRSPKRARRDAGGFGEARRADHPAMHGSRYGGGGISRNDRFVRQSTRAWPAPPRRSARPPPGTSTKRCSPTRRES